MAVFSARGLTTATAATADHAIAQLWNPDTAKRIKVLEIGLFKTAAGTAADSVYLVRSTARGSGPANTVTPDADNAWDGDDIPSSGALLDQGAFATTQPTKASPNLWGWAASAVAGAGIIWPTPRGLWIPPATGLVIAQRAATAWPISEVYWVWEE